MFSIKAFFVKYRLGLLIGVLMGLLVSNVVLSVQQNGTGNKVLEISQQLKDQVASDNKARVESRADSKRRDELSQAYLQCIARILILTRNSNEQVRINSLAQCDIVIQGGEQPNINTFSPTAAAKKTPASQIQPPTSESPTTERKTNNSNTGEGNGEKTSVDVNLPGVALCVPFLQLCTTIGS